MGDQQLWRKNIPEDYQGKMGENWDDEISMGPIYWGSVAIVAAVAFAFGLCWFMMGAPLNYIPETFWGMKTELSPLAEANERRLPPTPWLQPKPEIEMDDLLEEMAEHNSTYGWNDQLNGIVRIPVDRAMDLVADSLESSPAAIEPAEEDPVNVEAEPVSGQPQDAEPGSEADPNDAAQGEAQG